MRRGGNLGDGRWAWAQEKFDTKPKQTAESPALGESGLSLPCRDDTKEGEHSRGHVPDDSHHCTVLEF
jgi:hypothetical protein